VICFLTSSTHEIEGASHLAHYEYPERINPILIDFLTRPASEEAP
jgi:pimeloyl-ACP methyl ester carboxylesterase